jgi:hypothetical protein
MYVRFNAVYKSKTKEIHGVFSVAGYLFVNVTDRTNTGRSEDEKKLWELNNWFRYNLELPDKIRRSNDQTALPTAVSWFKVSASEHIKNLREISSIIECHGAIVEFLHTDKPGYILYEDEYQVFAEPT